MFMYDGILVDVVAESMDGNVQELVFRGSDCQNHVLHQRSAMVRT